MYQDTNQRNFARKMRNEPTDAKHKLWQAIRCGQIGGWKFRGQAAIEKYVVNFVCFDAKLVVEVDGGQHNEPSICEYDDRRTSWLESQGFSVLRYWNHDVLEDTDAVVEAIGFAIERFTAGHPLSPNPSPPVGWE